MNNPEVITTFADGGSPRPGETITIDNVTDTFFVKLETLFGLTPDQIKATLQEKYEVTECVHRHQAHQTSSPRKAASMLLSATSDTLRSLAGVYPDAVKTLLMKKGSVTKINHILKHQVARYAGIPDFP